MTPAHSTAQRVCIVGAGTRFLSGLSYYTIALANVLSRRACVSAVLMRELLPRRLYPGASRVGSPLTRVALAPEIAAAEVDWFWGRPLVRALRLLARARPQVVIFEWWTGTVLHTYLALALFARLLGARVVIEFHEALDVSEDKRPWAARYVNLLAPRLFALASAWIVHSEFDRRLVRSRYRSGPEDVRLIPHATYDHVRPVGSTPREPSEALNLLYLGVIRDFKGVEDLVEAFGLLTDAEAAEFRLTVVGETWEGWSRPAELIAHSPHRDQITFVNRYVTDEEVDAFFGAADIVVLPYRRSSQSGPLQIAMGHGLPVVTTRVGGLVEAVDEYEGAVLVPPGDPAALLDGIRAAAALTGRRYAQRRDWEYTAALYEQLLRELAGVAAAA